jgi:3-hydroxyisobutyrate dehydrogenase
MRIDAMDELTIGFVGLGNMGWPMAANLHAAGFSLVVRDADAARQARFALEHPDALTADSPAAFAVADIVVTMLPNGGIVRDALLDWGIATVLRSGALVVEMSSSDPSDTLRLAAGLARDGIRVVDAPASGGVPRAVSGELSLMVGGDDADVDRAQSVLRALGDPATRVRPGGADRPLRYRVRARPDGSGRAHRQPGGRRGGGGRPGDRARGRALGQGARPVRPGRRPVQGAPGLVG